VIIIIIIIIIIKVLAWRHKSGDSEMLATELCVKGM